MQYEGIAVGDRALSMYTGPLGWWWLGGALFELSLSLSSVRLSSSGVTLHPLGATDHHLLALYFSTIPWTMYFSAVGSNSVCTGLYFAANL